MEAIIFEMEEHKRIRWLDRGVSESPSKLEHELDRSIKSCTMRHTGPDLQLLVERELNGGMRDSKKTRH